MSSSDDPLGFGTGGMDTVPEHPGLQCHEVHPDRPHSRPAPTVRSDVAPTHLQRPTVATGPAATAERQLPDPAAQVDKATALVILGSDPWSRFDLWAQRAWEYLERAATCANQEGDRNAKLALSEEVRYDPRPSTLLDAARVCGELAREASPLAALAGLPSTLPEIELVVPRMH